MDILACSVLLVLMPWQQLQTAVLP